MSNPTLVILININLIKTTLTVHMTQEMMLLESISCVSTNVVERRIGKLVLVL